MSNTSTRTDRAKRRALYLDIAERLEAGRCRYTCYEIWQSLQKAGVEYPMHYKDVSYVSYAELFSPDGHHEGRAWWLTEIEPEEEKMDWRVTAMCFMAAMVEAGDA